MNQWSLEFPDEILEASYRLKTQTTISYPVFVALTATGIIDMLYGIAINTISGQLIRLIGCASLLFLSVLVSVLVNKYNKCVNFGLVFLILAYIIMSVILMPQNSKANIMMSSYSLIIANCIILYIQEFRFGVFQIICLLVAVLLIQFIVIGVASTSLIIAFLWLSLVQMFCIFKLQQQTRQFFLLSQKDSNIQTILSQIATRPFVIFDFDQDKFRFKQLYNHQISLSDILNSQFKMKRFGDYIYQRQRQNTITIDQVYKKDFIIQYNDKLTLINYSEFYLSQKTFMIILNTKEDHSAEKLAQLQISEFIKENIRALVHTLQVSQKKGTQILAKICLNNLIAQKTLTYLARPNFTQVNIFETLKNYLRLLELACINLKCNIKTTEYKHILTLEPLFCIIIIEILFQFRDCQRLDCLIIYQPNFLMIKFYSEQFGTHKPINHLKLGLEFIITQFKEVSKGIKISYLGFEIYIQIENDK